MNLQTLIFAIGIFTILYSTWKLTLFLSFHLLPSISSSPALTRYMHTSNSKHPWALITGASSGIGYGFAQALLSRNFNLILIARSLERLEDAKHRLEQEFRCSRSDRIRVLVLDAAASTSEEVRSKFLAPSIAECNITVLVNNVGGLPIPSPHFRPLAKYSMTNVDEVMDLNSRFAARATALLLPTLGLNAPSLVINVGSGAHMGIPWLSMYGAVKGFLRSFSVGLAREMRAEGTGVDVVYLTVGDTQSKSNVTEVGWKVPSSRGMAEATVERVGIAVRLGWVEWCPYWVHGVLLGLLGSMPESVIQFALVHEMLNKRKELDKGLKY